METTSSVSNRNWIVDHSLKLSRYLTKNFSQKRRADRDTIVQLLMDNSDEGRKLIQNFSLSENIKKQILYGWIYFQPQITTGIFADQRMGKDAFICRLFDDILNFCEENNLSKPRIVTLGNLRKPPFVDDKDMYFSFKSIPAGSKQHEVWIYCSEIETVLPSREGTSPENKLFSQLEGTMAQNHQKLFGCCKLASKVDLNFIRGMNVKFFKYISPEKLNIEGVERANIISSLGNWLLPSDKNDKGLVLASFDNQLFDFHFDLPDWWSDEYSEQFREVPRDKIKEYIEVVFSNGMNVGSILIAIAQKFRVIMTQEEVYQILGVTKG